MCSILDWKVKSCLLPALDGIAAMFDGSLDLCKSLVRASLKLALRIDGDDSCPFPSLPFSSLPFVPIVLFPVCTFGDSSCADQSVLVLGG